MSNQSDVEQKVCTFKANWRAFNQINQ